ncbi:MAG: hypothetical protein RSC68_14310 [Acinetobacter sp.]
MTDNQNTGKKRKALILLSSATQLPLRLPVEIGSISTGFFLVELAQILKEFEKDYEFTFCTPDGHTPQLDINGMSLPFMATSKLTKATISQMLSPKSFAEHHPELVERRREELELAYRHLGSLSVSEILPHTDPEAASMRNDLVTAFSQLPTKQYLSAQSLVEKHRDPNDDFSIADFDFIHFPGGHTPMVDFRDSPWLGEIINLAYENNVILSMICHAPIAMTSARFRIDQSGQPKDSPNHPFLGATITTVPKHGELIALTVSYPKIPDHKTRLTYYVDVALKDVGYNVETTLDAGAIKVIWDPTLKLLTSNGPQSIDEQAKQLRAIVG